MSLLRNAPRALLLAASLAALAGCASLNTLSADVASYGEWPAARHGGSYAFDRLPSQQSQAQAAEALEAAAQGALAKAGFAPAAAGTQPDVLVQVGARLTRTAPDLWADPLWWRGGFGAWRSGPWVGPWHRPGWVGPGIDPRRYEREVALLIRDRASGKPLYEARASTESVTRGDASTLAAMFEAALQEFPKTEAKPHRVTVPAAP